jgi:ketosteroid isomerase-like protein
MGTHRTLETWVERFNAGDATGISALYAEDAVNHQIPLAPVVGRHHGRSVLSERPR